MYQRNSVISGTFVRPTLAELPWGRRDRQALPPLAWCHRCGGEVYAANRRLCDLCRRYPGR